MRLRTTAIALSFLVTLTAGCTGKPVASGAPAASATPSSGQGDECETILRRATDASFDMTKTAVRDFYEVRDDPDAFSAARKDEVRRRYFEYEENETRLIAATITDAELKSALLNLADRWAGLAADPAVVDRDSRAVPGIGEVCPYTVRGESTPIGGSGAAASDLRSARLRIRM